MAEPVSPRILLVDDDPDIVRLVQHVLQTAGFGAAIQVSTGRAALTALAGMDIVLLDHQLPDTSGLEVLRAIRALPSPPAVILVTAHGNESLAAAALRLGADDYLAMDAALADLLPQILERVRRNRELRKALAAAEADLMRAERLAAIGEMTVTLHHEINNPLMAAFADVELLLADPQAAADKRTPGLESIRGCSIWRNRVRRLPGSTAGRPCYTCRRRIWRESYLCCCARPDFRFAGRSRSRSWRGPPTVSACASWWLREEPRRRVCIR